MRFVKSITKDEIPPQPVRPCFSFVQEWKVLIQMKRKEIGTVKTYERAGKPVRAASMAPGPRLAMAEGGDAL